MTCPVSPDDLFNGLVLLFDELQSMLPREKTTPMDGRIQVPPQGVGLVGDEVCCGHEVLAVLQYVIAD